MIYTKFVAHNLSNKKLLIICAICVTIAFSVIFIVLNRFNASTKTYEVTQTEDGFTPEKLTIKRGDIVLFKTSRNKFFWPASDLHPTHLIYPEFDPKDPIEPKKTWSFKFDKVGTWKYHDHLAPYFTGVIEVK